MRRTLGGTIVLETVLAAGLWRTRADPNQLENALLNLAVNARDAMPNGGRLRVEVAEEVDGSGHGLPPGRYVRFRVTDDGLA